MTATDPDRQALVALLDMLSLGQYAARIVAAPVATPGATPGADAAQAPTPAPSATPTPSEPADADATSTASATGGDTPAPAAPSSAKAQPKRVRSIADLEAHPEVWQRAITKAQHRDVLEGYLAVRARRRETGEGADAAQAERRFQTFQTVKGALDELRTLQQQKALLDASLHAGTTTATAAKKIPNAAAAAAKTQGMTAEDLRDKIEHVVDRIDDCKERLEAAQKQLNFETSFGKAAAAAKAQAAQSMRRPGSASSTQRRPGSARPPKHAAAMPPPSPRAPGEGASATTSMPPRPPTTETPRPDTAGDAASEQWAADVEIDPTASRPPQQPGRDEDDPAQPCHGPSRANAIGGGWFRNVPRSRVDVIRTRRVDAELSRRRFRAHADRVKDLDLESAINAALKTEAHEVTAGAWGKRQPPKVETVPTKRSMGTATFAPARQKHARPASAIARERAHPRLVVAEADKATEMRRRDLAVDGTKANVIALGVDIPLDHYAQMRVGALASGGARPRTAGAQRGPAPMKA